MLHPSKTTQFEKDEKKAKKQKKDFSELLRIMGQLIKETPLAPKYKDHLLKGPWKGCRDCHIQNDWVLIYRINKKKKQFVLNV